MKVFAILIWALLQISAGAAYAQSDSQGPVRIIVPFGPGGPSDATARVFAAALSTEIGSTVIVENRPGGSGAIGALALLRAPANGLTLLLGSSSVLVTGSLVQEKNGQRLAYDPRKDIVPVGMMIATVPQVLLSRVTPEFKTLRELIMFGQRNTGDLTYGTEGVGNITHLGMEMILDVAKVKAVHVPYPAGTPAKLRAVISSDIDMGLAVLSNVYPFHKEGRVKIHAVAGPERHPMIPDVPTLSEEGYPGIDITSWLGLFVRAGTPPDRFKFIADALRKASANPQLRESLQAAGFVVRSPMTAAQEQKQYDAEFAKWAEIVKKVEVGK